MTQRPPSFAAVLFDWRGTLVVAPTFRWLVETALGRLGREVSATSVGRVLTRLRGADRSRVDSPLIDTDADAHRAAYAEWFAAAGIDDELATALYAVESEPGLNPFADDVGAVLGALATSGVRIGVVSDIHVDLRPVFAEHRLPDGRTWAELVDVWVLSFEVGVAKPDPAVFRHALDRLGLAPRDVLMVGDRGAWDGAAADVGITTLVLPPLAAVDDLRLERVLDLVLPGRDGHPAVGTATGP